MNGTGTAPSCGFPQATTMEEYQQQLLEWKKQYDAYMAAAAATAAGTGTTMPATQGFPMASASPVPLQEIRGGTEAETEQAMHPKKVSKQKKSVNNTLPNLNVPGVSKAMLPKSVKVDEHNSYVLQTGEKKWIDPSLADWPDGI